MRYWPAIILAGILLVGCSSSSDNSRKEDVEPNDVPAAVQGACYAEHPYAKMDHPQRISNDNGSTSYEIPYVRPDGTKGKATYAPTGDLQVDQ